MNDDEKGKRFLELIDEQNNLQWSLVAKLSSLIASKWNSEELQKELETLVEKHSKITKELNSLDDNDSMK
jgi:formiminotetrahydrofolate cyclodeaminase